MASIGYSVFDRARVDLNVLQALHQAADHGDHKSHNGHIVIVVHRKYIQTSHRWLGVKWWFHSARRIGTHHGAIQTIEDSSGLALVLMLLLPKLTRTTTRSLANAFKKSILLKHRGRLFFFTTMMDAGGGVAQDGLDQPLFAHLQLVNVQQ
jgi:hypothetical protein